MKDVWWAKSIDSEKVVLLVRAHYRGGVIYPTAFLFSNQPHGVEETQRGRERIEYEWQTEMEVKYFRKHNY